MEERMTIVYNQLKLDCLLWGRGSEVILCLHGFGRSAGDFEVFRELIQPHQRLIAINLFAHGKSEFPADRISKQPLKPEEWCGLIRLLMAQCNFSHFHLIGYSMGGRIAMITLKHMPEQVISCTLLAPDGLKINLLYRFVSDTSAGRKLYRSIIQRPGWLLKLTSILEKLGILGKKLVRFVHVQLETRAKRQLVYDSWLIHRLMFPDLGNLAATVEQHRIPFMMIFGKYDAIIPPKLAQRLLRHFHKKPPVVLLAAGHRLINRETILYLKEKSLWLKR